MEGGLGLDLGQDLGSGEAQGSFEAKRLADGVQRKRLHSREVSSDRSRRNRSRFDNAARVIILDTHLKAISREVLPQWGGDDS